jgi:hypothetical protein
VEVIKDDTKTKKKAASASAPKSNPSSSPAAEQQDYQLLNLIDLAKRAQPDVAGVRVPFVQPSQDSNKRKSSAIDGILHYQVEVPVASMVDTNGDDVIDDDDAPPASSSSRTETYTIATPADHCVALCYHEDGTENDGDEDSEPLMQILDPSDPVLSTGGLFQKAGETLEVWFGQNLVLRNTPKTLTVMGDLDRVCDLLKQGLMPKDYITKMNDKEDGGDDGDFDSVDIPIPGAEDPTKEVSRQQLQAMMKQLQEEDTTEEEDDAFFDALVKQTLGDDYVEEEQQGASVMDEELLALFDISDDPNSLFGMFDEDNSTKGKKGKSNKAADVSISEQDAMDEVNEIKQMIASLKQETGVDVLEQMTLEEESFAERLFAFEHDGRQYSLVRMLNPTILVGKEDSVRGGGRHMLLSAQETAKVMPTLQTLCQEEYHNLLAGDKSSEDN